MDSLTDAIVQSQKNVTRMVQDDAAARSATPAAGAAPSGPTYRDFIFSAMQARQDAINRFTAGDMEGGSSRVGWLEGQLSNPEVARTLGAISTAGIPGLSEHAAALATGAWSAGVTAARLSGQTKSEGYLKATLGEEVGGLTYAVQTGTATPIQRNQYHRLQTSGIENSAPITRKNPATGKLEQVGSTPDTGRSQATVAGTDATLESFGIQPYSGQDQKTTNPDWGTFADTTQRTSEALYNIYGDRFHVGRTKTVDMVNKWFSSNPKVDPREKVATLNSLAPTLKQLGDEVARSPDKQTDIVEFLDNLPAEITQEQFRRDVPGALTKFLEYKKYDKLVRDNEQSFGSLDEGPSLSSMYQDASGVPTLVKHSFGDDDPTKTSVVERRIELGKRLENRDLENQRAAAGISRVLGPDGKPQAATIPEQIVARVYGAATKAIATAQATGNDELVGAIIDSSLSKIRDEFRRAGGGKDVDKMSNADLAIIARQWLDLDAVQGSSEELANAKKAIPSPDVVLAELTKLQSDPKTSQRDFNNYEYAKGRVAEAKAAMSVGPLPYSKKEAASFEEFKNLPPSKQAEFESRIEGQKRKILDQAIKGLSSGDFVGGDGVINISMKDTVFAGRGSARSARNTIFSSTGLDALIPSPEAQGRIVSALRGKTPAQATVVLKDILDKVAQPGMVEAIDTAAEEEAYKKRGQRGPSRRESLWGTPSMRYLKLVDPDHRTTFEPPESMGIALLAGAGVPAARDAMNRLHDAKTETKLGTEAARTYQEVLARLSPGGQEWFKQAVPGGIATVDDQLRDLLNAAFASGDAKGYREALKLSGELKAQASKQQLEWFDTVGGLLAKATEAAKENNTAVYEATRTALAGLKFPLGPMPESTPTPSAKPAAAVDN